MRGIEPNLAPQQVEERERRGKASSRADCAYRRTNNNPMKASTILTELEQFRAQKDTFFETHPHSPLLPEQQETFEGLRYFPEKPVLRLVVPIEEFADKDLIRMETRPPRAMCASMHVTDGCGSAWKSRWLR
jgi:uncharacterized protein (DUF1684 family)